MKSTDKNSIPETDIRFDKLWDKLSETFKFVESGDDTWFQADSGTKFRPLLFPPPRNAIVLEFANLDEGELYYLDEMTDDEIFAAVLEEIKL